MRFSSALLLAALSISVGFSQESRATLTGTVTDPQGAVLPRAAVQVKNIQTNVTANVLTNDVGGYLIPNLNPGQYAIAVTATGFKKAVKNAVELRVSERVQLDFQLELGASTDTITITAETPLLQTASASGGTTINQQLVADLPMLGSNPYSLMQITTGASHISAFPDHLSERPFDNGGMDGYSVNGAPAGGSNNQYLLDGNVNNVNEGLGFVPPPGSVSEVAVRTNVYDAEFGKNAGAITTVSLKSGTNGLHGTANWNQRNEHLNASLYQNNLAGLKRTRNYWLEPSITVTGPVYIPKIYNGKNRTFFMFSWTQLRDGFSSPTSRTYPTALERQGNFSQTLGGNGQPIKIYDPLSTVCDANQQNCTRTAFPNSTIPTNRLDPVIGGLMKYYPLPQTVASRGAVNFIATPNIRGDVYNAYTSRVDQTINDKNKFFASIEYGNRQEMIPNDSGLTDPTLLQAFPTGGTWRINFGTNFNLTTVFTPSLINTARVGFLRHNGLGRYTNGDGFDPTTLGYSKALTSLFGASTFPGFAATGYTGFGNGGGRTTTYDNNWTAGDTLSKVRGNHTFKFGIAIQKTLRNQFAENTIPTLATFGATFTQANPLGSTDPNSGDALATALLGYPNASTFTPTVAYAYSTTYYAPFVQDDWRVNKKLTLNLGFRWDYQSPFTERYNRQIIGFDPNVQYSLGATSVKGGPIYASPSNRTPYSTDMNNFGPRVGIAYSINNRLVFRGGYGITYAQSFANGANTGFSVTNSTVQTSTDGSNRYPVVTNAATGAGLLANGGASLYPFGLNAAPGSKLLPPTVGGNITVLNQDYRSPRVQQFNAGFQIALPMQSVLNLEYNGTRTDDVSVSRALNTVTQSQFLSLNTKLTSTVANPYGPQAGTACLSTSTISLQQSLFAYPQFCGITLNNLPVGSLTYDSLQARLEKRLSHGFTFLGTFTWGKNLGATDYLNGSYDDVGNLRRTLQSLDQKFHVSLAMTYQIPFKNGFSSNAVMKAVSKGALGGWTISSIITPFQTGSFIAAPAGVWSTGVDPTQTTPYWKGPSLQRWFNTCTITAAGARQNCLGTDEPAAWIIQPNQYVLQSSSPRWANFTNARGAVADVSIFKAFHFTERSKLSVSAQAFNIANTPWFGAGDNGAGINVTATNASFGQVNRAQGNDQRLVQVALKLDW